MPIISLRFHVREFVVAENMVITFAIAICHTPAVTVTDMGYVVFGTRRVRDIQFRYIDLQKMSLSVQSRLCRYRSTSVHSQTDTMSYSVQSLQAVQRMKNFVKCVSVS